MGVAMRTGQSGRPAKGPGLIREASRAERLGILPKANDSVLLITESGSYVAFTVDNGTFIAHDAVCKGGGSDFAALIQRLRFEADRMGFNEILFHVFYPGDMEKFVNNIVKSEHGRIHSVWAALKVNQ